MNLVTLLVLATSLGVFLLSRRLARKLTGPHDIREDRTMLMRLLNALVGFWSPIGNPEEAIGNVFSVGRKTPQQVDDTLVFRATVGWRYGYLALIPFVIGFIVYLETGTHLAGQTPAIYYLIMVGFLIWAGAYMWIFRLEIDVDDMSCTSALLTQRQFDLWDLTAAKTTRDGYTLYFTKNRKISVPRFIEGHDAFKALIIARLDTNGQ